MIVHAKQKEEDVLPITQVFYYPLVEDMLASDETLRLMDLDENLLKILESGER